MAKSSTDGRSIADRNKASRQEDMRTRISESNLLTDVITTIAKMSRLAKSMRGGLRGNLSSNIAKINALQMTNNNRFKLLNKILPDLKVTEIDLSEGTRQVFELNLLGVGPDGEDEVG